MSRPDTGRPRYSVVIPAYNAEATLGRTLDSIRREFPRPTEVIVVDDGSSDNTLAVVRSRPFATALRCERNSGPGAARNLGVRRASGDLLVFLDADVILCSGFFATLHNAWQSSPDPKAIVGMLTRWPAQEHAFARYKAAHMYAYTRDFLRRTGGCGANFTTQVGVLERELFLELGGFAEGDDLRWIEDDEFGYRLARKAQILLVADLEVEHHFENAWPALRKVARQSALWTRHFLLQRRCFDRIGKTPGEAWNKLTAFGAFGALLVPGPLGWMTSATLAGAFLFSSRSLLTSIARKQGLGFAGYAAAAHACVGVAAGAGALLGVIRVGRGLALGAMGGLR